ncbi:MAG: gliding motility-associated C-terminal domain-containing protein, partial [Cyclobacteriaceae bacterium]
DIGALIWVDGDSSLINGLGVNSDTIGIWVDGNFNTFTTLYAGVNLDGMTVSEETNAVGIYLDGDNNWVGDTMPGKGNVISGNKQMGVYVNGQENVILNNYIGLGVDGITPLPNLGDGINIGTGGTKTLIGNDNDSSSSSFGNYISANGLRGIFNEAKEVEIYKNKIGVDINGGAKPNGSVTASSGILIQLSASSTAIVENEIANHAQPGITVRTADSVGIFLNSIYNNGTEGIQFINSPQNGFNNTASITSYDTLDGKIEGTVPGLSGTGYVLQFFADNGNQGQEFLDTVSVNADGSFSVTLMPEKRDVANMLTSITAMTVEFATSRTSQFSAPFCIANLVSSAGEDRFIACQGSSVQLNAELAVGGVWNDVTEYFPQEQPSLTINNTDPVTTVSGFVKDTTYLEWEATTGACTTRDTVAIIVTPSMAIEDELFVSSSDLGLTPFTVFPLLNDILPANNTFKLTVSTPLPLRSSLTINSDNIVYTPPATFPESGLDTIYYSIVDTGDFCTPSAIGHVIIKLQSGPITANDDDTTFSLNDDCLYEVAILDNDINNVDINEVVLTITNQPENGTAYLDNNLLYYSVPSGLKPADSLAYSLTYTDSVTTHVDTAIVRINFTIPEEAINAVNDVLDSTYFVKGKLVINPLLNDEYDASQPIRISIIQSSSNAKTTVNAEDSTISINILPLYYEKDSIQYRLSYGCTNQRSSTAWIVFQVGNNAPIARDANVAFESLELSLDITRLVSDKDNNIAGIDTIRGPKVDSLVRVRVLRKQGIIRIKYESIGRSSFQDSVYYKVCDDGNLCDSAWVYYTVNAEVPIIYNAISPNDVKDGYNDMMRIGNIETYTYRRVQIFNRQGIPVYDEVGYNNEEEEELSRIIFEGKTANGEILNPGSYLCILKYGESENKFETISTYIVLKSSKQF